MSMQQRASIDANDQEGKRLIRELGTALENLAALGRGACNQRDEVAEKLKQALANTMQPRVTRQDHRMATLCRLPEEHQLAIYDAMVQAEDDLKGQPLDLSPLKFVANLSYLAGLVSEAVAKAQAEVEKDRRAGTGPNPNCTALREAAISLGAMAVHFAAALDRGTHCW